MTSVILPTRTWTPTVAETADAVAESDELVVVCDAESDPVVDAAPDRATVVPAGEPESCSGKANALATGMDVATDDIVVWTDDDVARDDGWLDRLTTHARDRGAATEVPVFVGGGAWRALEPAMVLTGTRAVASGEYVWGGGVAFDRTRLDETSLLRELRRTVGDDTLLSQYVDDVWADTTHLRPVSVGGSLPAVYHRLARFAKTSALFSPVETAVLLAVALLFTIGATLFPLAGFAAGTALGALGYRRVGLRRWTVLLSFPSLYLFGPLLLVGICAPRFWWGGRTYAWHRKFDVTVDP